VKDDKPVATDAQTRGDLDVTPITESAPRSNSSQPGNASNIHDVKTPYAGGRY
jgi:hypothetical protein